MIRPVTLAALAALLVPASASAHAVVYPKSAAPGAYERYMIRVPNEKGSPTTRVEIRFPGELRVISFADVPGWTVQPVLDSAQRIVGAVWTGTLPPQRFIELPFIAVNPKESARIVWPIYQTYADGERVEWTGAEGSKTPASVTEIAAEGPRPLGGRGPLITSIAALAFALIALGLALRPRAPAVR
ncbi:MAG TPA: YcnI family protein [Gemmatimonadaceae bacterium]|nr:YcnI family protein [Gemmatimonadaceae bacterium]